MGPKFRLAAIALLLLLAPAVVFGYPITPRPLWSLVSDADLIVIAKVAETEKLAQYDDPWTSATAHLTIVETLKGPELKSLKVPYAANMVCPAPARYVENETVVAFLARNKGGWRTVALSYGTLYPQGAEVDDVKTMIAAARAIQESPSPEKTKELRKREWLVRAAALPGTRWHGLYELEPGSDSIRSFYDRSGRPKRTRLAKRQREFLAEAFLKTPKMDPTFNMMLAILRDHQDPLIDQMALGGLEGLLALESPPWWVRDLLWTVLARFGDTQLEERLEQEGTRSWDATPEQLRSLWSEAKYELGIPEVPPTEIELDTYIPVGGRTPS